mgnify:CR=1 FL=1
MRNIKCKIFGDYIVGTDLEYDNIKAVLKEYRRKSIGRKSRGSKYTVSNWKSSG